MFETAFFDHPLFDLLQRMGPLAAPLLLCSVLSLALIMERGAALMRARLPRPRQIDDLISAARAGRWERLADALPHVTGPFGEGAAILIDGRRLPKALRDERATLWLDDLRRSLEKNLKLLQLIAVISPLLGLLGTVIGMIVAFQDIAALDRPVNPAVVADGLWQAMLTTAFGLVVALPALFFAQVWRLWAGRKVDTLESHLNHLDLALEAAASGLEPPRAKEPTT